MTMEATTRRMSLRTPESVRTREEVLPICLSIVSDQVKCNWHCKAYQKDNRDVEKESDKGVCKQNKVSNSCEIVHGQLWDLDDQSDDAVHYGAGWCKVVERDKRIHFELGGREETLDHGQTDGLKDDSSDLEEEPSKLELDFSERGNHNSNDNHGDVSKSLEIWWCDTHAPGREKDSDRSGGLERPN